MDFPGLLSLSICILTLSHLGFKDFLLFGIFPQDLFPCSDAPLCEWVSTPAILRLYLLPLLLGWTRLSGHWSSLGLMMVC